MNRYHIQIIIRVILISLNCFALIWIFTQTDRPATTIFFLALLVMQVSNFIYFSNKVNRELANFLIFLQENDTTLAFSSDRIEKNFKGLTASLAKINLKLQQARIEKEQKQQFLQMVVNHIGIGLLSFNEKGVVEFVNDTAKNILGFSYIQNIEPVLSMHPNLLKYFSNMDLSVQGLTKINTGNVETPYLVKTAVIKFNETKIKLVSFQNIKSELDEQEMESWRKLIRILRHEIMNSITPIITLTTAIKRIFTPEGERILLKNIKKEHIDDALLSTDVIEERSKGLIGFVEKFKSLTEVPKPKYSTFKICKLFENIEVLFSTEIATKRIHFDFEVQTGDLMLKADEHLIEQVLINLVKNSIEAIQSPGGKITLKALKKEEGKISIQVIDNGTGIKPHDMGNIFVPSFSTKEKGTGIGLNISKQIMKLHNGDIIVKSVPEKETIFELQFMQN